MKRLLLGAALGCLVLVALFGGFERVGAGTAERIGIDYPDYLGAARTASSYPGMMTLKFSNPNGDTLSGSIVFDPWLKNPVVDTTITDSIVLTPSDTTIDCDTTWWDSTTHVTTTITCDTTIGMEIETDSTPPDTTYDTLVVCDTVYAYKDTLYADSVLSIACETTTVYSPTDTIPDTLITTSYDSLHYNMRAFKLHGPMFPSMYEQPLRLIYRDAAGRLDTLFWPDPTFKNGSALLCDGVPIPDLEWTYVQIDSLWYFCTDSLSMVQMPILYD